MTMKHMFYDTSSQGVYSLFYTSMNPSNTKLNELNFHSLEVVSRYRDTQLQVKENYAYLFNL